MALITRFTRLFTADLHALLDRLEEPDVVLKQAIREMEDELAAREQRIRRLDLERDHLIRQLADIDRSMLSVGEQLDVCFVSSEEQLARPLLRRRLELERLANRLAGRRDANAQAAAAESACRDDNQRELDTLRQHAELLLEAVAAAPQVHSVATFETTVTDEDVEVALLREKQRRSES
jgi:phage shock protein A